jgi:valyl-tRNA synthetase
MGIEFMGSLREQPEDNVPFRVVYIHSLVRDAEKQKMSKTRGNVIDPLEVTEKYGTDAVRFTLAIMAAPGTDIALSEDRMDSYRKFANKIWNAARFLSGSLEKAGITGWKPLQDGGYRPRTEGGAPLPLEDRWLFSRLSRVAGEISASLDAFRFHEASHVIYHFFWHEFCDWYLELKKFSLDPGVGGEDLPADVVAASADNLCRSLDAALRLLHPMMPFITEELWQRLAPRTTSIALAPYPAHDAALVDEAAEREMTLLQEIIGNIRNMRAEMRVDAKRKIPVELYAANGNVSALSDRYRQAIERLANLSALNLASSPLEAEGGAVRSLPEFTLKISMKDAVDLGAERARLVKELEKLSRELQAVDGQLGNEKFLSRAPEKVVASLRERKNELAVQHAKFTETLGNLG